MKRLTIVLSFLVLLVSTVESKAASSVTWTSYRYMVGSNRSEGIEVHAVYTCHTDGTFDTIAFYENEVAEAAGKVLNLAGYFLYQVVHDVGATGVTDNSDLSLLEHSSTGYDVLGGAGTNFLDNADATPLANTKPWLNGSESAMPIYGPLYIKIENNAVNSATGSIIFKFIR
jgi:hypothetical protein